MIDNYKDWELIGMGIHDLEIRVANAELKVGKCQKTITRHEQQLEKKENSGITGYEIESKKSDIKGATQKLEDAERILQNWKDKLNIEIEKERFLEGNSPQVIKDFLEDWKEKAYEWHIKRYEAYRVYRAKLEDEKEAAQLNYIKTALEYKDHVGEDGELTTELTWVLRRPTRGLEKNLKELGLDWRSIRDKEEAFAGQTVLRMCGYRNKIERLDWLATEIEKEKKEKMMDLITRIYKEVGAITDATGLQVSANGNLDGVIDGEDGKAQIRTIEAGGWRIQCFHYRTIIRKL